MKKFLPLLLLLLTFLFSVDSVFSADRFWVGGTGNWSDINNWSATSGGAPGATVPGAADNAIFDDLSLLGVANAVIIDVPVDIISLDFSAVSNSFIFDSPVATSITISGSIIGNVSGVTFTGVWPIIDLDTGLPGESITSGGTVWVQDFVTNGELITIVDDFNNGTSVFQVDSGGVDMSGVIFTCGEFISLSIGDRDVDISNSIINVNLGLWSIDSTNLNWTSGGSVIFLGDNTGTGLFEGGSLPYDILSSVSAIDISYFGNNSFELVQLLPSSLLQINAADTLSTDSLIATGSCVSNFRIKKLGAGLNGVINKTGFNNLSLTGMLIDGVNASTVTSTYDLALSAVENATGWTINPADYYWIGDSGDWNDVSHWSFSSGGPVAGCLPSISDSVFFDVNSFSITGQEVIVDDTAFFGAMHWTGFIGSQTLSLDSSIWAYGDVVLDPNLTLVRNSIGSAVQFNDQADFFPNSATIDANISLVMPSPAESLQLQNDLVMSDTSSIILFNGTFTTLNNDVRTGTLFTANDPTSGADNREIIFGSSNVELLLQFNSTGDTTLIFNAGTSHLTIGDTNSYDNGLSSEGLTFNDVTLNFKPLNIGPFPLLQAVRGPNSFNKLEIIKGSHIYLQDNVIQTVNDSLIMAGNCQDSIWLRSLDTSATNIQASISKALNTDIISECVNVGGINYVTPTITTLFSTDLGNNTNWTFDATPPTTAGFTFTGSSGTECFGDTVFFTNTSTAYSGDINDLTIQWSFNDDTLGFVSDTNAHIFLGSGVFNVTLQTQYTNFCTAEITQAVLVNEPILFLTSSEFDLEICDGESVTFETSSPVSGTEFEFFLNGTSVLGPGINDTLYTTTTLNNGDTLSAQSYLNGCASDSVPQHIYVVNPLPIYTMTSTDSDTSICAGDLVSFTGVGGESTSLYQYRINGTNVTSLTADSTYSTTALADNDVITLFSQTNEGCTDSSFMTFNVDALPTTALTSTELGTIICEGTSVTFTASGAATYEFFINGVSQAPASTTTTLTTSALVATDTVSVVGYSVDGCSFEAPQTFNYSFIATPTINLTSSDSDTTICSGETVNFTASGGSVFEFFINGASQGGSSAQNTFSSAGLLNGDTVYVEGFSAGCPGVSSNLIFTVIPAPSTVLTSSDPNDTICQTELVTFTGSGATNYEFFVGGVSQGPSSATTTFATSSLLNGQVVTVVGESNGCLVQDQLTYTVLSTPSISLFSNDADNIICDGEAITLTSGNAASYQLYVDGSPFGPSQPTSTFVNPTLPIGTSAVYVEGTGVNGCTSTSLPALSITVNPIPTVVNTSSDSDDIICAGESVTFTGSGSNLYQFFINGVSQTSLSSNSTFTSTSLVDGNTVQILGSSLGCTSNSNVITMTVNPVPVVVLTSTDPNSIWCADEVVTFNGSGATNYEFVVDGVSQGASSPTSTINSSSFPVGSYNVQLIGESNNCFATTSMGININPLPVPTLTSSDSDDIICDGESVTYTAGGGSTYEFFVDGVSQGTTSAISTFTTSTLTTGNVVSVVVTSGGGCTETAFGNAMTVNPIPTISLVSSEPSSSICVGESVTFTASGGTDYEFFLNGVSQGPSSPTTTLTSTTLVNGDVIGLTGTVLGCSDAAAPLTFTVYDYPLVSLVNNGTIEICDGELTDLTASGASDYQFLVNGNPTGPFSPNADLNTSLLDGDVVTVTGELNGCPTTSTDSYTFTVYDYPTIITTSSDADNIICLNDLISFTASGAMTYDFALNGNVLQSGSVSTFDINTLVDGDVISITGFNGDCPSVSDTYVFTVNSMNLGLLASPSNLICEGDAVTFTASGADNYEFFLNGTSTGPLSATNTYTSSTLSDMDEVTFTGSNNTTLCIQEYEDLIIMNVIDEPSITALSALDFCEGDSVILVSAATHGNQWYLDGAIIPGATDTSYVAFTSGVYSLEVNSGGTGTIWAFGQNASGALGNGENINSTDPVPASSVEAFDELSSGYDFVVGITTSGDIYSWGDNSSGQLGDGTYTSTNLPQAVPTLSNVKTAATSQSSVMVVSDAGDVYVWGNNSQGQLGTGNTSVINFPFLNTAITNVDSIAGGRNHFVILRNDGTVWTVGNNSFGQLGQNNLLPSSTPVQVTSLSNIVSVGAGEYQSFAIDNNGNLFVWGNNSSGQLGLGDLTNRLVPAVSDLPNIINAQGGASHSAFLSSDNKVFTAGANGFGQLGSSNFVNTNVPVEVDVPGATMISTGQYTTLVKRSDKSVFGFGNNTEDQLSSQTGLSVPTPEYIDDLNGVEFIEAGRYTSHFIYNEAQACVSPGVTVDMLAVPAVSITVDGDTLTASAGVSYQWYLAGSIIPGATSQTHVVTTTGNYYVDVTYANGCTGTSPIHSHSMADIEALAFGELKLYPNPTNGLVNLEFENAVIVDAIFVITDQAGRIVQDGMITGASMSIDVTGLENGMYNLILSNGGIQQSIRFVKSAN